MQSGQNSRSASSAIGSEQVPTLDHADAACSISITQPDAGRPFTGFKSEPLPPKPNNTEALGFASWAVSNVVTGPAA